MQHSKNNASHKASLVQEKSVEIEGVSARAATPPRGYLQYYGINADQRSRDGGLPSGYLQYHGILGGPSVQLDSDGAGSQASQEQVFQAATLGVSGAGGKLPHLEQIQASFGHHDVSGISAHVGGAATAAAASLGANAYAFGNSVAFQREPSLHTAAHEAAHVVQQRAGVQLEGGVGKSGDRYEQHADAVADAVVSGRSAEPLLKQYAGDRASAGVQAIQKEPIAIASLGMAVFASGQTIVSGGSLSHTANTPSYMHERTPAEATWETATQELHIAADNPRYGIGEQNFYYRLTYERNGYDIRNAQVVILRDRSSSMFSSSFSGEWSGQTHSRPNDQVCQIIFNISGRWDPIGNGDVSWWGQLILSAAKGAANTFTIGSERWVRKA